METSINIPDHVIEEILLRLPVKHLLRWKCVSKHWYSIIWDDHFVKKHYHFHYDMHLAVHGDVPLLLDNVSYSSEPTQLHLISKDGERYVAEKIAAEFERDTAHVFARVPRISGPRCLGLVNGVVCLKEGPKHVVLWNPATREIKDVPVCPIMTDFAENQAVFHVQGFGFDLQSNDFKILGQINTCTPGEESVNTVEYHIYSLKADSWKRITDALRTNMFLFCSTTDSYFKNGVYYWIAGTRNDDSMRSLVSFNFISEIFKEFELPVSAETWVKCRLSIGKYNESLAVVVTRTLESKETCFEIWTVTKFRDDEYEAPSSWQLVVKVPAIYVANGECLGTVFDCGDILINVHPPKTSEMVEVDGNLAKYWAHIYQPSTRTFNYLGIKFESSYKYVESMFPLSKRLNNT